MCEEREEVWLTVGRSVESGAAAVSEEIKGHARIDAALCCVERTKLGVGLHRRREVLIMGPANCSADADATRRRAETAHVKLIVRTH